MKYSMMVLAVGVAFAFSSTSASASPRNGELECHFKSKKGTKCRVDIEISFENTSVNRVLPLDFYLECNNGFVVDDDNDAVGVKKDNDGWVIAEDGEERDDVAIVELIDLFSLTKPEAANQHEIKAELIIASDHRAQRLNGACEFEDETPAARQ